MRQLFYALCLLAFAVAARPPNAQAIDQPVRIAVDSWPPYIETNSPDKGMATEVVLSALKAVGLKAELVFVPWARALDEMGHGHFVASYPWIKTEKRAAIARFSDPIMRMRFVFFYRRDRLKKVEFKELTDLRKYSVVGMLGYYYLPMFKEAGLNVYVAKTGDIAFKMLHAGRIDLLAEDEVVGWDRLKRDYPDAMQRYAATETAYTDDPAFLLVSKKHPDGPAFLKAFNRGLRMIKESGEYDRIVNEYTPRGALTP